MSHLSITFLAAALVAAVSLTLLQAQIPAAEAGTVGISNPGQAHANGHDAGHEGH